MPQPTPTGFGAHFREGALSHGAVSQSALLAPCRAFTHQAGKNNDGSAR
jgi:glutamate synthase domain-containing protein 2